MAMILHVTPIISAQRTLYPTNIVSVPNPILFQYEIVETECNSRKFNISILLCILLHFVEYLKVFCKLRGSGNVKSEENTVILQILCF